MFLYIKEFHEIRSNGVNINYNKVKLSNTMEKNMI